jgi:hypothetical protein
MLHFFSDIDDVANCLDIFSSSEHHMTSLTYSYDVIDIFWMFTF